jgi:hypothetical protein
MATIPPDTPANRRRLLQRLDVLAIAKGFGFVPLGEPDANGWQSGVCPPPVGCGLLNVGWGPERGNWLPCSNAGPGCRASCASLN